MKGKKETEKDRKIKKKSRKREDKAPFFTQSCS